MIKSIDQAVNQALNDLDLTQSKAFQELMSALYVRLDDIQDMEESMAPDAFEAVCEVWDSLGEFTPT